MSTIACNGGSADDNHLNSLSWGKNLEVKPLAWPNWNEKRFKESVQDFFLEYLQTAYMAEDHANATMPAGDSARTI